MSGFSDYPLLLGKSRSGYLSKAAPGFDTAAMIVGIKDLVRRSRAKNPDLEASQKIIGLIERLRSLFKENPRIYRNEQPSDLTPMQPIIMSGAFNTTADHFGIYVGYGVVLEVSAETCASNLLQPGDARRHFLRQCFGATRLRAFGKAVVAGQQKYEIIIASANNEEILARFDRAIRLLEKHREGWKYDILRHNCQHATNTVVYDKDIMSGLAPLRSMFSWLTGGYGCEMPRKEGIRAEVRAVL